MLISTVFDLYGLLNALTAFFFSFFDRPLSQAVGYVVVLGFGALFSIFTTILVYLDKYFGRHKNMTSEHFK